MIHEHEETGGTEVTAADRADDFEMSALGNRLMEIRKRFIAEGGKLLTREELDRGVEMESPPSILDEEEK